MVISKNKVKRYKHKGKHNKSNHFQSYDVRSSLNKYELMNPPCLIENSMDRGVAKGKKKMKAKRNSSISKMPNNKNPQPGIKLGSGYGSTKIKY